MKPHSESPLQDPASPARAKPAISVASIARFLVIVVLVVAIVGGAAYFTRALLFPHRHLAGVEFAAPPAFIHPVVAEVEKARELRDAGKPADAQKLLRDALRLWPVAPETRAARELLGEINTALFFSDESLFGKTEYVVKRGDSLSRIARKLESTPALIMRANQLDSDRIHPGDRLVVPDSDFTLTLDLVKERAVVHHGDGFFVQYPLAAIDLPRSTQPRSITKVTAMTYWKDGEMIHADTPAERAGSTPWLHFGRGYALYGVSEEEGVGDSAVEVSEQSSAAATEPNANIPPHGIALMKEDFEELQRLIGRGTPVTILRPGRK